MTLVEHARNELEIAGFLDKEKDFYGGMTGKATLELMKTFAKQRHSGMSASIVRELFHTLSAFSPLSPLTGEPDEWRDVTKVGGPGNPPLFQNKRCSRVFADDENGKNARDVSGKVFVESESGAYTNVESQVPVTFPYTPKTEYVNVESPDS